MTRPDRTQKLTETQAHLIRVRAATGKWSIPDLAEAFGVHRDTIRDVLRYKTWRSLTPPTPGEIAAEQQRPLAGVRPATAPPLPATRGEAPPLAGSAAASQKLTEQQAHHLRIRAAAGGWSISDLAEAFGVHPQTVRDVLRYVTWKHLPLPSEVEIALERERNHAAGRPDTLPLYVEDPANNQTALPVRQRIYPEGVARYGTRWNELDDTRVLYYVGPMGVPLTSERLGRSDGAIRSRVGSLGQSAKQLAMRAEGMSVPDVAEKLGVSPKRVYSWIAREWLPSRRKVVAQQMVHSLKRTSVERFLRERGALLPDLNPQGRWQRVVAKSQAHLQARLISQPALLETLGIGEKQLRQWQDQGFPAPALKLYGQGGTWYERAAVRAWLQAHHPEHLNGLAHHHEAQKA